VVRERDNALECLAQVGAATHKGNIGGKPSNMLQGIMTEFGIVVKNAANERQNAVAEVQVILVVHAVKRHGDSSSQNFSPQKIENIAPWRPILKSFSILFDGKQL
jgi:phosphoglycerate dehydrogenase-like enzyme